MWIPRQPSGPGGPGPGPGWSLGPSGSPPRLGSVHGFLYHLCRNISSCFYVFCCCWLLEECFGGPRRLHNHLGPPYGSPDYRGPLVGPEPPEFLSPPLGHFGPPEYRGPLIGPEPPEFPSPPLGHFGPPSQPGPIGFHDEPRF